MQKNNYSADEISLLYNEVFSETNVNRLHDLQINIEEFGLSVRDLLTTDVLIKNIAYERAESADSQVFLCYNWKRQTPFILIKREVHHITRYYTPQYGHEDNYPESQWTDKTLQFFTPAELSIRQPQVAAILESL